MVGTKYRDPSKLAHPSAVLSTSVENYYFLNKATFNDNTAVKCKLSSPTSTGLNDLSGETGVEGLGLCIALYDVWGEDDDSRAW